MKTTPARAMEQDKLAALEDANAGQNMRHVRR